MLPRRKNECKETKSLFFSVVYVLESQRDKMHHNIRMPEKTNAITVFPDLMQFLRKALEFACIRTATHFVELKRPMHADRIIYVQDDSVRMLTLLWN
jgi:hypothetical protein